jgi:hypothetical protein
MVPGGLSALEAWRDLPRRVDPPRWSEERTTPSRHLFDGSDRLDSDSLQRLRSRARSTGSTLTSSAPQDADSGAAPWRLQSLIIRGGGAPNVQVSLAVGKGQGLTTAVAEVGRSAPEQPGEHSAVVEVASRSGASPELVGTKCAAPERGSSGRPVNKSRVRSKM